MSPDEFKEAQHTIGWTARRLCEFMDLHPSTLVAYRKGHRHVPLQTARVMQALASGWRPA